MGLNLKFDGRLPKFIFSQGHFFDAVKIFSQIKMIQAKLNFGYGPVLLGDDPMQNRVKPGPMEPTPIYSNLDFWSVILLALKLICALI